MKNPADRPNLKTAVVGTGFMGRVHTENLRRLGNVSVCAVVARTGDQAREFAQANSIETATDELATVLGDNSIDAIHICTPNDQHFAMAKAALQAGKHVLCEKPLASTVEEASQLLALAEASGLAHCTFHNLRFYPHVQTMRRLIAEGAIGDILAVQGTYSQDWLLYPTDWNWRVNTGSSRTFADIGTHWCDLAEHVTGLRLSALVADLATFHETRHRPVSAAQTFSAATGVTAPVQVQSEDFASMMFRLGDRARGSMTVSQVSAGRKNRLLVEIFGTKSSLVWNGERPDELWQGHRNQPNQILIKDAGPFADLPAGHSEGYDDTFKQLFRRFYRRVADPAAPVEYPTFADGLRQLQIVDAVLESSRSGRWVSLG